MVEKTRGLGEKGEGEWSDAWAELSSVRQNHQRSGSLWEIALDKPKFHYTHSSFLVLSRPLGLCRDNCDRIISHPEKSLHVYMTGPSPVLLCSHMQWATLLRTTCPSFLEDGQSLWPDSDQ